MSSISTFSLVLLLLLWPSFQYYSCSARSLGVFNNEPAADDRFNQNSSNKKNDEINMSNIPARVSVQHDDHMRVSSMPNETSSEEKSKQRLDKEKVVNSKRNNEAGKNVEVKGESTVTWKVPHQKKGGDEQPVPGFNLDYLPPRTHPPVHN